MTAWPRPPRLAPHKSTSIPMHAMCLWIYDFDLFRMRPAHLLVNSSPPCADWLAPSRERKWPPSHVWYSCRPLRWKARRVWFLAACPEHFCLSNPPITVTQRPFIRLRTPFSFLFYFPWIIVNSPAVLTLHHLEFGTTAPNLRRWNVLCTATARAAVFFSSLCPRSEPAVKTLSASWYSSLPKPCSHPSLSDEYVMNYIWHVILVL